MTKNFEVIQQWWNDMNIDLVRIDDDVYALYGWNGEKYLDCWKCAGDGYMEAGDESFTVTPIYSPNDDEVYVIGYYVQEK